MADHRLTPAGIHNVNACDHVCTFRGSNGSEAFIFLHWSIARISLGSGSLR